MILQSTDELEEYIGNKYSLVIVSAKRARQLKEGHPALSRDPSPNPLSIALREVYEHKLQPVAPPDEDIAPAPRDLISSLVATSDFVDLDDDQDLEDGDAVDDLAAILLGTDEEEEEEETATEEHPLLATPTATTDEDEDEEEDEEETDLGDTDDDAEEE